MLDFLYILLLPLHFLYQISSIMQVSIEEYNVLKINIYIMPYSISVYHNKKDFNILSVNSKDLTWQLIHLMSSTSDLRDHQS